MRIDPTFVNNTKDILLEIVDRSNDNLNKQEITDPKQWCGYTQKMQGIFNKIFAEHEKLKYESYHFTDGLKQIIINPLIDLIQISYQKPGQEDAIKQWQNAIKTGSILLAKEFFDKIVNGEESIESIGNASYDYPLSFGMLESLPKEVINDYYELITKKFGNDSAQRFAKLLSSCTYK